MNGTKVYLLGAGCSCDYGYPLGDEFLARLESFGQSLTGEESKGIRQCVMNTVELLKAKAIPTLDELVARIENGVFDKGSWPSVDVHRERDRRIFEAKLATSALFFSLEPTACKQGLQGYTQLLREIFPGHNNWSTKLKNTNCRVLTFNYDRLFEIEFVNVLQPDTGQFFLYGPSILNSGLSLMRNQVIIFESDRFCYLKLHGSIGMMARDEYGKPYHYVTNQLPTPDEMKIPLIDNDFFRKGSKDPNEQTSERLIVFPNEKDRVRSNSHNRFPYREYIVRVWEQAARVVADASEIWIVGYSFSPIDRPSVIQLLSAAKNCEKIVVQNPDAHSICQMLKLKYPELKVPIEAYVSRF
ncbi:MAG: hypothetical protein ACLQAH_05165 [Limisphaerales bacterium]